MAEDPKEYVIIVAETDPAEDVTLEDIIEALPDLIAGHDDDHEDDGDDANIIVAEADDSGAAHDPADPVAAMQAQLEHQQQSMVDQINHSGEVFDAQMAMLNHSSMGGDGYFGEG